MMHALEVPEFKLCQPRQLGRTSITTWVPGAGIIQFGTINWGGQGSVQRCQPATTQKAISEDFALPFFIVEPVITNLSGGRA